MNSIMLPERKLMVQALITLDEFAYLQQLLKTIKCKSDKIDGSDLLKIDLLITEYDQGLNDSLYQKFCPDIKII